MRQNGVLLWLLGDHLGSTHKAANRDGSFYSEQLYKPWGGKRYPAGAPTLPTTYRYTGQRQETGLGPSGGEGLYYYGARHYDPYLNRWIQPDIIISDPGNSIDWDRYAYTRNNPVKYIDPNGHEVKCPQNDCDKPLFVYDYSNLGLGRFVNALAMTAIEVVASPVCWLVVGCHVDWGNNIIIGPTGAESMHNAIAGSANPIAMVASPWAPMSGSIFREFLPDNFRINLMRLTGLSDEAIKELQAHHVLPQIFRSDFAKVGLNVDDPVFGAWVDLTHQTWTKDYQDEWASFFRQFYENDATPTIEEIFAKAQFLAEKYGFTWTIPSK